MTFAFLNIGTSEMVLIMVVALLLFGGKKLPELARGLGRGIREFKDASEDIKREISDQINNFEREIKDIDVMVEDKPKASSSTGNVVQTVATASAVDSATTDEVNTDLANTAAETEEVTAERKFPQFSTPDNTVQHNPGGHPADDSEYYKYGYNDYFAGTEEQATSSEEKQTEGSTQESDTPIANTEKKA